MNLARLPMHALVSPWRERSEAWARSREIVTQFEAYAREIGCEIMQDSIVADGEQARKLATWWTEHTK